MLFNSPEYGLFLPVVLGLFYLARRAESRRAILLIASYVFYGAWDWRFLGLIWLSTLVDFFVAKHMTLADEFRRRRLLLVSLAVNLGVLGAYKYFDFFAGSAAALADAVGVTLDVVTISVILPVGISFYTFQTMSYTIDVFRNRIEPEPKLSVFALYVAFFPQLVAGPIERAQRLLPQLRSLDGGEPSQFSSGVTLILRGLFKKVAIADGVAQIVGTVFGAPSSFDRASLSVGVLAFGLQIYGDFSGYTDIARGSARLLGVDLVENFRQPYLSRSVTEFWRRWHISLSAWLRDYLYIPLGGNRRSERSTYRNLMVTMLLGGLWHGASWAFVLWGGIHGLALAVERRFTTRERLSARGAHWIPVTVVMVLVAWIPFRAGSLDLTLDFATALVAGGGSSSLSPRSFLVVLVAFMLTGVLDIVETQQRSNPLEGLRPAVRGLGYAVAILFGVVFSAGADPSFLYFQF